jgi:hypothetical protein
MQIATDLDYHNMKKHAHCGKIMDLCVNLSA